MDFAQIDLSYFRRRSTGFPSAFLCPVKLSNGVTKSKQAVAHFLKSFLVCAIKLQ